uniref:RIIa domain-containing protein 1 isoform X2 n=1 Tax=Arvicanthis niloticus TaxID=61156 RepID=UPI0014865D9A|nr:RIIa domain-containing protein 1 isoform X2 [Arvicanthis niloticus]
MESGSKGLVKADPGTLSPEQLEQLRDFKIQTRIANEKYLRTHKEVSLLISGFFRRCFLKAFPFSCLFLKMRPEWHWGRTSFGED